MRSFFLIFVLSGTLLSAHNAQAALRIFACEPEWAALAKELTPADSVIDSATTALQDVHHIQARPSLIAKMRRADLLICSGADLEIGWLPLLIRKSANPKVQPGTLGYFEAAAQVERLDVMSQADRSMGDVHPQGNPHVQLDPRRILTIAQALSQRLVQIDGANAAFYQQRYAQFAEKWRSAISAWQERAAPLKGARIVTHHSTWVYLFDWLGIESAGTLEPKPGLPPTTAHLAELKAQLQSRPARMTIYAPYLSERAARWLAEQTGTPAVMLPQTVGGSEKAKDLFSLFDDILDRMLAVKQ